MFLPLVAHQIGGEVQGFEFCHQAVQVDRCNIKEPKLTKDKIVDSVKCLIFYEEAHPPALLDTVRRPLKEAFLASKIVILDYFSRELPF